MDYGRILREIRMQKGIKASWVAKRLGLWPSAVRDIETGKRKLTIERVEEVAKVLGSSLNEVLSLRENETQDTPPAQSAG